MIENSLRDLFCSGRKVQQYVDFINSFQMKIRHEKGGTPETQLADFVSRSAVLAKDLFCTQISKEQGIKAAANEVIDRTVDWRKKFGSVMGGTPTLVSNKGVFVNPRTKIIM